MIVKKTIADAILDRIIHESNWPGLKGESFGKRSKFMKMADKVIKGIRYDIILKIDQITLEYVKE